MIAVFYFYKLVTVYRVFCPFSSLKSLLHKPIKSRPTHVLCDSWACFLRLSAIDPLGQLRGRAGRLLGRCDQLGALRRSPVSNAAIVAQIEPVEPKLPLLKVDRRGEVRHFQPTPPPQRQGPEITAGRLKKTKF